MSGRAIHAGHSFRGAGEGGQVLLRLVLATVFIAHGSQKLFGGFGGGGLFGGLGGGGLSSTARFMAAHGLTPGFLFAVLGGLAEFAGGILIALGLLTVFGAAINIAVQIGAIATQTWAAGFFVAQHSGFEYNLVLIAALLAVAAAPGRVSLDHLLLTHLRHARGPAAPPASASVEAVPPHAG